MGFLKRLTNDMDVVYVAERDEAVWVVRVGTTVLVATSFELISLSI